MIFSQRKYVLFFIFIVFVLFLFFSKNSWAQTDITRTTPCGKDVVIGSYQEQKCCHPNDCCSTDADGECVYDGCCTSTNCNHYTCNRSWWEYRATTEGCGPNIERRHCRSFCSNTYNESCCEWCRACDFSCGIWEGGEIISGSELCEECESWQKAVSDSCQNPKSGNWCPEPKPECKCCGCPGDGDCAPEESCVETPINLKVYQSPVSDTRIDNLNNIRLPIRLVWDDVPGWEGGWQAEKERWGPYDECKENNRAECEEIFFHLRDCCGWFNPAVNGCLEELCEDFLPGKDDPACAEMCPAIEEENGEDKPFCPGDFVESYVIEITGEFNNCYDDYGEDGDGYDGEHVDENTYRAVITDDSQFFPPCPCFFKPGRTYEYEWRVRACCTDDGKNCGPWSKNEPEMQFTTSRAPEPILPFDPNWIDSGGAENVSYDDSRELEWCRPEDPDYYELIEWEGKEYFTPLSYEVMLYRLDKDTEEYVCTDTDEDNNCIPLLLAPRTGVGEKLPPDIFLTGEFVTKDNAYAWQVRACRQKDADECSDYSQLWEFETTEEDWDLIVTLINPSSDSETPIGFHVVLRWSAPYAHSFKYKIHKKDGNLIHDGWLDDQEIGLYHEEQTQEILNILKLDKRYEWYIQPCWDPEAEECEEDELGESVWYGPWYFRTTGRPPQDFSPEDGDKGVFIPIDFSWERVPGAKSYRLQVDGVGEDIIVGERAQFSMNFTEYNVRPGENYSWQVKTCALPGGEICGDYSNLQNFETFTWESPIDLEPDGGDKINYRRPRINWSTTKADGTSDGARFYRYEINIIDTNPDDPKEECEEPIEPITNTVSRPPVTLDELKCWGLYEWSVTPCLDAGCTIRGPTSTAIFEFLPEIMDEDERPGLIPCGQKAVYLGRPWLDETEPCSIKHLFIMLYLIVNFLFINIVPAILVLMILASGIIFYFSLKMEAPNPAAKVKSLWKAAGIGIGILLLSWTITSLILVLFGYRLGPWYVIGYLGL